MQRLWSIQCHQAKNQIHRWAKRINHPYLSWAWQPAWDASSIRRCPSNTDLMDKKKPAYRSRPRCFQHRRMMCLNLMSYGAISTSVTTRYGTELLCVAVLVRLWLTKPVAITGQATLRCSTLIPISRLASTQAWPIMLSDSTPLHVIGWDDWPAKHWVSQKPRKTMKLCYIPSSCSTITRSGNNMKHVRFRHYQFC